MRFPLFQLLQPPQHHALGKQHITFLNCELFLPYLTSCFFTKVILNLFSTPSIFASIGAPFSQFTGQTQNTLVYFCHFSIPSSVSEWIASTGHSGSKHHNQYIHQDELLTYFHLHKTINWTYINAIHMFTFNTIFINYISHKFFIFFFALFCISTLNIWYV